MIPTNKHYKVPQRQLSLGELKFNELLQTEEGRKKLKVLRPTLFDFRKRPGASYGASNERTFEND